MATNIDFEDVCRRHGRMVRRIARHMGRDEDQRQEFEQTIWLEILSSTCFVDDDKWVAPAGI